MLLIEYTVKGWENSIHVPIFVILVFQQLMEGTVMLRLLEVLVLEPVQDTLMLSR